MFDLPNAKRIRRDDIHHRTSTSPSPSPTPPPAPETLRNGHERLGQLLNLDVSSFAGLRSTPGEPISHEEKQRPENEPEEKKAEEEQEDEEQEFEFRLFRTATAHNSKQEQKEDQIEPAASPAAQKLRIRLRSPSPGPLDPSQGRFVRPFRGWEYYFTTPGLLSSSSTSAGKGTNASSDAGSGFIEKRRQFEDVAVSGDEVVRLQQQAWPGCHLPWRVIHLKREDTKLGPGAADAVYVLGRAAEADAEPKSRRKPGKKRRVQLRKRAAVAERAKETEAEKRNRKNRERKIKRRQKAREMKAAGQVDGPGDRVETDGSSEGDDE